MSEFNKSSKEQTEEMAEIVEKWLGNPLSKYFLKHATKREDGERRIEKILKDYSYEKDVDLTLRDKFWKFIVGKIFSLVTDRTSITEEDVKSNLEQDHWRKGLVTTLEGLAWRGPEKPFTSYAPFLIVWNFTNACNLNCKHCYQNADKPTPDELTTEEAKKAVDEMAKAGVAYIALSGGEPLVRNDIFEVIDHIRENEMAFSIATNGTILAKDVVEKLEDRNCQYVQVSVDGSPKTHNEMRGSNKFQETMKGVKNVVDSDITVGLAMTVTSDNYEDVDYVIDKTEEVGANIFMHYNFIPTGRGEEIKELDIGPEQREKLLVKLVKESERRDISILSTAPQYGRVSSHGSTTSLTHFDTFGQEEEFGGEIEFLAEFVGGCGAGRLYAALQSNGDITPCVFLPKTIGNIKKDNFTDIWQNNKFLNKIRNREEFSGECGECEFRNICGGCRARAYAYYKNVQEKDPGCILNNRS